jgi:hypothetical protein
MLCCGAWIDVGPSLETTVFNRRRAVMGDELDHNVLTYLKQAALFNFKTYGRNDESRYCGFGAGCL